MIESKHHHILIIGSILTIGIIFAISYFMTNEQQLELTKTKNKIIEESPRPINYAITTKREDYVLNEKPFAGSSYEYDERTPDFRLVCTRPCPVPKNILDQEFSSISYAVSTLRGLTQSDINKDFLPFEVHASEDQICHLNTKEYSAYATSFTDANGYSRGLLCFFYDKIPYNRDKFPYSTSVHEVTHLFEFGKIKYNNVIYEGLSEMLESFFLKGNEGNSFCWQENAWFKEALKNSEDPHWIGGDLFFELCNQYGFDYKNLPELFRQLELMGGNVDEKGFVKIINNIVGSDTSKLFKDAGLFNLQ